MAGPPVVYTDDADAVAAWVVTDNDGQNLGWSTPQIAVGGNAYANAAWVGSPAPSQTITLAMPLALGLLPGVHTARLKVPNGTDFDLGPVYVRTRS